MNLLTDIPAIFSDELTDTLLVGRKIRIERIVSRGHASPKQFWYDQDENEWLILLQGSGTIRYPNGSCITLTAGEYLHIPAHHLHQVSWTDPQVDTIWLAVFYSPEVE
ncbi:cupin domain-containing protein [Vibrio sp.]|uniref:cupin domain-containing protein n=1 Tax=Vibrio sp. TaxID=678 RepID=UPI003D0FDB05